MVIAVYSLQLACQQSRQPLTTHHLILPVVEMSIMSRPVVCYQRIMLDTRVAGSLMFLLSTGA